VLTRDEMARLAELGAVVERGLHASVEVAFALIETPDGRLYRASNDARVEPPA
jgi:hypothetical protein